MRDVKPDDVAAGTAWAVANDKQKGVGSSLDAIWTEMHRLVEHDKCMGIPHIDDLDTTPCQLYGVCVCSVAGKLLNQKARALERYIKRKCTMSTATHRRLGSGNLVIQISGGLGDVKASDDALLDDASFAEEWWHLGYVLWSPYLLFGMQVAPVADLGETAYTDRRVYVQSLHCFKGLRRIMEAFVGCKQISARLWILEEASRPLGTLIPDIVPVIASPGADTLEHVHGRRRRVVVRGGGGPAPAAAPAGAICDGDEYEAEPAADANEDLALEPPDGAEPAGAALDVLWSADLLLDMYDIPLAVPAGAPADRPPVPEPRLDPRPMGDAEPPLPPPAAAPQPAPLANAIPMLRGGAAPRSAPGGQRQRGQATACALLAGGRICYYSSNGNFVAYCKHEGHESCIWTKKGSRVGASSSSRVLPPVERPLGRMAAWIALGAMKDDKDGHFRNEVFEFSDEQVRMGREALAAVEGGAALLSYERAPLPGEAD